MLLPYAFGLLEFLPLHVWKSCLYAFQIAWPICRHTQTSYGYVDHWVQSFMDSAVF